MRPTAWEWTQTALLMANLAWTTLCLGGYRPETMLVTCLLTGVTLVVGFVARFFRTVGEGSHATASLWLLPFLAYAALNVMFVTPVPWLGWLDWLGWANLTGVFAIATGIRGAAPRRALFASLVGLAIVAVGLGCYQRFVRPDWLMLGRTQMEQFLGRASGSFGIPNSFAALLLLLLPATGALACRRRATAVARVWWGWVTLVLAFGLVLTISRGALIGLALALAAWPWLKAKWSWTRRVKICAVTLLACTAAATLVTLASPHTRERFTQMVRESGELSRPVLWRAAWNLFLEKPVVGTGAGSFNVAFERHRPARFLDEPQWAHNDYLNTLSDYGVVGFALFFGAVALFAWRARRGAIASDRGGSDWIDAPEFHGALGIGLVAFALQLFVDFHFKIPALAMAFAVGAALALARRELAAAGESRAVTHGKNWIFLGAALAVAAAIWPAANLLRAEALRYRARQAIDRQATEGPEAPGVAPAKAVADLQRATTLAPGHASAWADLSFALQLEAWASPARTLEVAKPAELAARRALALSVVVPEFWLRLGVALDLQGRFPEAEPAFKEALRLAPNRVHAWYYYAYHLSLDSARRPAAREALGNCLARDPGNHAAAALLRRLNERQ